MRDKSLSTSDPLPEDFATLDEFWNFWDAHSSADYEDMMTPVEVQDEDQEP